VTWFLARLGEIIEDFPLTVPVEVDEAHQCVSRLSRHEEMQIWSRGHVPLGVWFSVIHSFLQACETCEVPVEAERFCSTLKIACQSWSPIIQTKTETGRTDHVWGLEMIQISMSGHFGCIGSKPKFGCHVVSDYHGFSAVVLFRWARNGHARLDPQFGGYFVLRKVPHVFPCFKEKDMIY